jgi:hypothetical protein
MAKKWKYSKSPEEVVALVDSKVRYCSGWYESKLSKERQLVQNYYNGTKPLRQHQGSSTYTSSDVYDSVEMMKAQLLETFAMGHEIVRFDPVGPEDVKDAKQATAYTAHMIFEKNDGFGIFNDLIHDGLTTRAGIVKTYWDEYYDESEEEFEALTYDEVQGVGADKEVDSLDATMDEDSDPMNPTYSGTLVRMRNCAKVCYDVIPGEEFLIEERAESIADAKVTSHRTLKTRSELKKLYPKQKSKIDNLAFDDVASLDLSPDYQSRKEQIEGDNQIGTDAVQPELDYILLYETHMEMAIEKDGVARLYRVVHAGTNLFEISQVDRKPYIAFVPLPIPHMFYGNNFAHRVIPHQTARTALTRAILDHASITNNPRMQVLKGGLLNPRELLDNRLGGLVNVNRPDAITPIPQAPLNPFTFEIIKMVKENREETTGISSLSQGLNKDAISKQNSSDLIEKMVTVSQQRQKIIARNFGKFCKELWLETYRLIIENETEERIFEYSGEYTKVNPTAWIERRDVTVSLHLGYGEQEKEAGKFVRTYQLLAQDPVIAPMFTVGKRHKLIQDAMIKNGIKNVDDYLERPENVKPPGPDPMKMKELEIDDKKAEAALQNAKAQFVKIEAETRLAVLKAEIEDKKLQLQLRKQEQDAIRQDADTANRIDVSQREIELAEKVPPEGQRGIFSPNS